MRRESDRVWRDWIKSGMYLQVDRWSDNIAVIDDSGEKYKYGDIVDFSKCFGKWIPERSLIFILCKNCFATIAAHIACIDNHIVPLMISANMDVELLKGLIDLYKPMYIWCPDESKDKLDSVLCSSEDVAGQYGYLLIKLKNDNCDMYEDLAMLLTTSGTTGSPKLIRHSYFNLYSNAENVANVFGFSEQDRALVDLKLHYTMGLNVACSNLYCGATIILTEHNPSEKEWWNIFREYKPTNMCGVPYSYEILKQMRFFRKDHEELKIIAQGGGKLSDELFGIVAKYAVKYGKRFFATFGTSETTARLAYLNPDKALEKIGSIGKAIPCGEMLLVDEFGNYITDVEAEGELVYRGPNVTLGYAHKREDLAKKDERNGEYFTGDIARRDAEGYYYVQGRKGRFLKVYGYRVGLDECETILKNRYESDFACTGTDERLAIYHTNDVEDIEIRKFMSEKTGIQISAFYSERIDFIPRNENGKINYGELLKRKV